ncbi:MAG: DUF503 domain-containing protein [Pseudomonadota bacterium]
MVVGVLELALAIPAITLKEKRSVVKRVVHRTRTKFNVAVAEVDELDNAEAAVIGVVAVGNDRRHVNSMLDHVATFVDDLGLCELVDESLTLEHY